MAITNGKLERAITASSWSVSVTEVGGGGGPHSVSLANGTYYLGSSNTVDPLPTAFAAALTADANLSGTYTCTASVGEGGTGKVTLSATGITSFALTWTSTDLRDALGFTDGPAITGASSYTSTDASSAVWLPDCPIVTPYGSGDNGLEEADAAFSESPAGNVFAVYGQRKRVLWAQWEALSHAKARIAGETVVNTSWEKYHTDSVLAAAGFAAGIVGGPHRLYWDADSTTTYVTCKIVGDALKRPMVEQVEQGWIGLWVLRLDRLVEVPS